MTIKTSTALANAMLGTTGAKGALASCVINLYSGTEPSSADAALSSNTLLATISKGGDGTAIGFADAASRLLAKDSSETWTGTVLADGTPTFFRVQTATDAGAASTTAVRLQGSVGSSGDLKLGTTTLTTGNPQSIDYFEMRLPEYLGA